MKKSLLLALLFPATIFAQNEFGYHATWHYEYSEYGYNGYKKISHVSDTNMLGMNWLKFEVTGASWLKTGPDPDDIVIDTNAVWDPIFLSTKNDSVFRLNDTIPYLLYDFSASIGESWKYAPNGSFADCDSIAIATTSGDGVQTIDGQSVRYMDVTFPMDTFQYGGSSHYQPSPYLLLSSRIYLDFGSTFYNILFEALPNVCNDDIYEFTMYNLRCFSNDSLSISFTNQACDFVPYISMEEYETINFEVYPNPTNGLVNIKTDKKITNVEVYSLEGQKLLETIQTENIELPASSGMYVVAIYFEDGRKSVTKVVRE